MSALSSTRETHIGSDLSVFPFDADLGWLHRHTDTHTEVLRPPPPQRRSIPAPSPHDGPDRVPNRKVSAFRLEQVQVELVSWRPDHRERDGFDIRPRTTFQFKTLDRVHCGPSVRWREDGGRRFGSDDFRNGFAPPPRRCRLRDRGPFSLKAPNSRRPIRVGRRPTIMRRLRKLRPSP